MILHKKFMRKALHLARIAYDMGEVPVGAVVVRGGRIVGAGYNMCERLRMPIAHAEIIAAIRATRRVGMYLDDCVLYVTLEPCIMCMTVLRTLRISQIVFGCRADARLAGLCEVVDVCQCGGGEVEAYKTNVLKKFFELRRVRKDMERWLSG